MMNSPVVEEDQAMILLPVEVLGVFVVEAPHLEGEGVCVEDFLVVVVGLQDTERHTVRNM
jgi:hypothetical protein